MKSSTPLRTPLNRRESEAMNSATKKHPTSHAASRVKAPAKGGDNLVHGFASQPGWKMYTGGNLSWQYPLGSNRPMNTGSPSFCGTVRHWQFTHVLSMRSTVAGRAQRASSMSGGPVRSPIGAKHPATDARDGFDSQRFVSWWLTALAPVVDGLLRLAQTAGQGSKTASGLDRLIHRGEFFRHGRSLRCMDITCQCFMDWIFLTVLTCRHGPRY